MRDEQKFFQLLKPLRRQLLWITILKYGQIFVLLCSGIWFIWQIFGRLFFIYHLENWFHVLFFLVFVYCAICFFRDKPSWYQTGRSRAYGIFCPYKRRGVRAPHRSRGK